MTQKAIGPSFPDELKAAGLLGLPFFWDASGDITFDPSMTAAQVSAVEAVYAAHNPATPSWSAYQQSAQSALDDSDTTMHRVTEAIALGLNIAASADVVAFVNYRRALRAIVSAASGTPGALPTRPAYPAGT